MPTPLDQKLALIGVPLELGAGRRGCAMGPAALRTAAIVETLRELGRQVDDLGDIAAPSPSPDPAPQGAKNFGAIAAWTRAIDSRVREEMARGAAPILLGGDHALAMGSIHGVAAHWRAQQRELFVLWLDAHADFNTPATSPSGNMHGMSVAMLCGEPGFEALLGETEKSRSIRATCICSGFARSIARSARCSPRAGCASSTCGTSTNSASSRR